MIFHDARASFVYNFIDSTVERGRNNIDANK